MTGASDEGSSLCDIAELRRELLFVEYFHLLDETRALRHRLHRALADVCTRRSSLLHMASS